VVILEPKRLYRTARGEVSDDRSSVPLGSARVAVEGEDVTLIAYGAMVPVALAAASELLEEGTRAEVLDLRTLTPLDTEAVLRSVRKTGRVVVVQEAPRTAGFAAEVAALVADEAVYELRGPIVRVTGYDIPYPSWRLEDAHLPSTARVVAAARRTQD
jgi:pyruvate/2-oxoglutarate/acetoin dehydrogenase E1 component